MEWLYIYIIDAYFLAGGFGVLGVLGVVGAGFAIASFICCKKALVGSIASSMSIYFFRLSLSSLL
jgi:hypothetical protein